MTLKQTLNRAREILAAGNIEDCHLESELLLRQVLKIGRVQLYIDLDNELTQPQVAAFGRLIKRRLSGEPSAYICRRRQFYGYDFYVDSRVLIPRPESELLVDKAISLAQKYRAPVIADIGTGCGAIAISLALKLPQAKIYATDISAPALKVARLNCRQHGLTRRIHLLQGDLLKPLPEAADIIVANLPYVKQTEIDEAGFEPLLALDGGGEGTDTLRRLCHQAADKLNPGSSLLLEIGQGQEAAVRELLKSLLPAARVEVAPDLAGIPRVVSAHLALSLEGVSKRNEAPLNLSRRIKIQSGEEPDFHEHNCLLKTGY